MKHTQLVDALRNIKKNIVSFVSISIVIALGVAIFLACNYADRAIKERADSFYREYNYRDIEIRTRQGLVEDDVKEIQKIEGVTDAEGLFSVQMLIDDKEDKAVTNVISKTDRIDRVLCHEGSLPSSIDECSISVDLANKFSLSVGDTVTIKSITPSTDFLVSDSYIVSGIFDHPSYYRKGSTPGLYVMILNDAVDTEKLHSPYTGMLLKTDASDFSTFSEEYSEAIRSISPHIEKLGKERSQLRFKNLYDEAAENIKEGEDKLSEAKKALDEAEREIDDKEKEIKDGENKIAEAEKKVKEGKKELSDAETRLKDAKAELDASETKLNDSEKQLAEGRSKLDESKEVLDAGYTMLEDARIQLEEGKARLEEGETRLEEGKAVLDATREELDSYEGAMLSVETEINSLIRANWPKESGSPFQLDFRSMSGNFTIYVDTMLESAGRSIGMSAADIDETISFLHENSDFDRLAKEYDRIVDGEHDYADGLALYESEYQKYIDGKAEYETSLKDYNDGLELYNTSKAEYDEKEAEYESSYQLYQEGLAEYNKGVEEYNDGLKEYEEGKKKLKDSEAEIAKNKKLLADGKAKLEEGKKEFEEKQKEYDDGYAELLESKRQLERLEAERWIPVPRTINASWDELSQIAIIFSKIGSTFALLFVILAILVCYATIGRIIGEQRKLVGTTKAVGFTTKEILLKYFSFGVLSSLIGVIAGILISYFVLEKLMLLSVEDNYSIGGIPCVFLPLPAIIAIAFSLLIAAVAAWIACRKLLKEPARSLMSGWVPQSFYKKGSSAKTRSLYANLISRNIRADIKRVLITVVSIVGCCMLLIIGFSFKKSYDDVIKQQFSETIVFDAIASFVPDENGDSSSEIETRLTENNASFMELYSANTTVQLGDKQESVQLICADPTKLNDYYRLRDEYTKQPITIADEGATIFANLAEIYDIHLGDSILLMDERGTYHDVTVSRIYHCNAGRTIFLSKDFAKDMLSDTYAINSIFIRSGDKDIHELVKDLEKEPGFLDYTTREQMSEKYHSTASTMNYVIIMMIFMAAIMAAVVLLNLVRIQITQKRREMTIMRINGFSVKETVAYILRENIITTSCGLILGIVIGYPVSRFILRNIDAVDIRMIREIMIQPGVYALLITLFFAAAVNFIALRKIKDLSLKDI